MEHNVDTLPSVDAQFSELLDHDPRIITYFVPANKEEQLRAVIEGDVRNPDHDYASLKNLDFDTERRAIADAGAAIMARPDLNPKHAAAYEQFVDGYQDTLRLMELARDYKAAETPEEKEAIRSEYMRRNIEKYGEPDEQTYRSLLQEKLKKISEKDFSAYGNELRKELFEMTGFDENATPLERFKPSAETVEWMKQVAEALYGEMLLHIPNEKEEFSVEEAQAIFQEIIDEEFGEAADGWHVDIEEATSIKVEASKKRVVIPRSRPPLSREKIRGLVVHELGVHMLRSVMGSEADLAPLGYGLDSYYDSEEGLGVVMEQALRGKLLEAGIPHYITAGAAYFDNMDFRDVFEMNWRLDLLSASDDDKLISAHDVAEAKRFAYNRTLRSFRGTDELPWFKDLAYYNGAVDTWRHLESIRGDDTKFMFVLLGKGNPANIAHERIIYETATK